MLVLRIAIVEGGKPFVGSRDYLLCIAPAQFDARAAPDSPGGAREIAEAVDRDDCRLLERRHVEGG